MIWNLLRVSIKRVCLAAATIACFYASPDASAQTITLDSVLEKALKNSYDLKLADVESKVAKADTKIARADFFPTLTGSYNTQFSQALTNQLSQQQVAVVGNTVLPGSTGFQHVYTLGANYTLFDGGSRLKTYKASKLRVQASSAAKLVLIRDLKLTITQIYTDALLDFQSLQALKQTAALHKRLFSVKQELQAARNISKVELAEEALQLAAVETNIERLRESLGEKLNDLAQYTQQDYQVESINLEDLPETVFKADAGFDEAKAPDLNRYNREIESKQAELQAISAQRLPQVAFYSNLIFYGSNRSDWGQALFSTAPRQVYMGLNISMPLFDGFKNAGMREKKRAEIEHLKLEKEKKLWELKAQLEKCTAGARQYQVELQTSAKLVDTGAEKVSMVKRLNEFKIADIGTLINEQIAVIEHGLSLKKARTMRLSLLRKAAVIQG